MAKSNPDEITTANLLFRVRKWFRNVRTTGQPYADVWLIQRDGAAHSCLQFGQLPIVTADHLAEWFRGVGVAVEIEERRVAMDGGLEVVAGDGTPAGETTPGETDAKFTTMVDRNERQPRLF